MAWIDCERTGIFQIGFCFGRRRVKRSLRTRDQRVAEAAMHRVEENIRLVTTGRLTMPLDADLASFTRGAINMVKSHHALRLHVPSRTPRGS